MAITKGMKYAEGELFASRAEQRGVQIIIDYFETQKSGGRLQDAGEIKSGELDRLFSALAGYYTEKGYDKNRTGREMVLFENALFYDVCALIEVSTKYSPEDKIGMMAAAKGIIVKSAGASSPAAEYSPQEIDMKIIRLADKGVKVLSRMLPNIKDETDPKKIEEYGHKIMDEVYPLFEGLLSYLKKIPSAGVEAESRNMEWLLFGAVAEAILQNATYTSGQKINMLRVARNVANGCAESIIIENKGYKTGEEEQTSR